jgi:hypothetical protein
MKDTCVPSVAISQEPDNQLRALNPVERLAHHPPDIGKKLILLGRNSN